MAARDVARLIAAGRVVAGLALVVAPRLSGLPWLGADAGRPAVRAALRMLGVRDVVLGAIALHTIDPRGLRPLATRPAGEFNPRMVARWQATCAAVDAVDCAALIGVRGHLPAGGGPAVAALAAAGAAGGAWVAHGLRSSATQA